MSSFMPWSDGWILLCVPGERALLFHEPRTATVKVAPIWIRKICVAFWQICTCLSVIISLHITQIHQVLMINICSWYQSISIDWVICHLSYSSSKIITKYHLKYHQISSNIIKYHQISSNIIIIIHHQISPNIENSDFVRISKEWNELEISRRWDRRLSPKMPSYGPSKRWGDRRVTGDRRVPKPWAMKCGGNGLEWVGNSCFTCFTCFRMVLTV